MAVETVVETKEVKTQETQQNSGKEEILRLRMDTPLKFEGLITAMYMDSIELCDRISSVFKGAFADYFGCKLDIVQNGQASLSMYFCEPVNKVQGETRKSVIERIISNKTATDMDMRIRAVNNFASANYSGKVFKMTKEGKEMLEVFAPYGARTSNGKVNWDAITLESTFQNNMGYNNQNSIYYRITLDVNRVVAFLFGDEINGENYQYQVLVGNPINPVSSFDGRLIVNKWQIFVQRLSRNVVEDLAKKQGVLYNNLGII